MLVFDTRDAETLSSTLERMIYKQGMTHEKKLPKGARNLITRQRRLARSKRFHNAARLLRRFLLIKRNTFKELPAGRRYAYKYIISPPLKAYMTNSIQAQIADP